jgi:hypothetical protein
MQSSFFCIITVLADSLKNRRGHVQGHHVTLKMRSYKNCETLQNVITRSFIDVQGNKNKIINGSYNAETCKFRVRNRGRNQFVINKRNGAIFKDHDS